MYVKISKFLNLRESARTRATLLYKAQGAINVSVNLSSLTISNSRDRNYM